MKHLQCNNFSKIPEIISNDKGLDYIKIGDFYGYITEWIDDSRQCNYSNPVEVMMLPINWASYMKRVRIFI